MLYVFWRFLTAASIFPWSTRIISFGVYIYHLSVERGGGKQLWGKPAELGAEGLIPGFEGGRLSVQQRGIVPRNLNLDPTATPYVTFSHVQLDPLQEQYNLENAEAHRSQSRREFQGMIPASQEQIMVDIAHLLDVRIEQCLRTGFADLVKKLDLRDASSTTSSTGSGAPLRYSKINLITESNKRNGLHGDEQSDLQIRSGQDYPARSS